MCIRDSYQAESSAPLCFPCSPGKTQSVRGQRSCEKCADGKYQSEAGQTTCDTPDRTRVAVDGVAAIRIPPGFEAVGCDSRVCTAYEKCQSGYFSDFSDDGRPKCKKCVDADKYGPGYESPDGSSTCTACPKGRYLEDCLLYTSPSPRDLSTSRMPSSA